MAVKRFYSSDEYRMLYEGENYLEKCRIRCTTGSGKHIFDTLSPIMKERNLSTVLEIGCAGGWNLIHFLHDGYEVTGYDYSHDLTKSGRSLGLNLIQGSIEELNSTNNKYDVIILNHVIEHFTDIFKNMKLVLQHLNTDGILYIGLPNIDNFDKTQFQNAHVYYFTPRTFGHYMKICSLKNIKFGSAEEIHMYGIYIANNESLCESDLLNSEYSRMKRLIAKRKFRSIIVCFLEKIKLKKSIKSLLNILGMRKQN